MQASLQQANQAPRCWLLISLINKMKQGSCEKWQILGPGQEIHKWVWTKVTESHEMLKNQKRERETYTKWCNVLSCSVKYNSLRPHGQWAARLLYPWDFSDKDIGRVTISSFRESSQLRNWTQVSCISCIGTWILYHWATCRGM